MVKVGCPSSLSVFGVFACRECDKDGTLDNESSDDVEPSCGDAAVSSDGNTCVWARAKRNGL